MIFKPSYEFETGCAAYLFGCGGIASARSSTPTKPSYAIGS